MKLHTSLFILVSLTLGASACAHTSGTDSREMSASEHDVAAADEESEVSEHEAQHDPSARVVRESCTVGRGRVCWSDTSNPTDEHKKMADEHRALAAKHRAASQMLKDAEAKACVGISDEDRDMSPFAHVADIESVSQLSQDAAATSRAKLTRDAGATIVFRAAPGLTAEWLQRIVDCHIARNAAVGHEMPEMGSCPLVPRGAKAAVRTVGDGFAVDVYGDDAATAAEIWRRAQQIKPAN
jgi:hypothetical protein